MKFTYATLALAALCESAIAASAGVYLYDPQSPPRPRTTLDPVSARLVLAQRAGVEDYHTSDLGEKKVVDAINAYGVRRSLFAKEASRLNTAFILLEEHVDDADADELRKHMNFEISPIPGSFDSRSLFVDLAKQADSQNLRSLTDEDAYTTMKDGKSLSRDGDLFYVAKSMADFEAAFNRLMAKNTWTITALVAPSSSTAAQGEWGTYEMPGKQSPLKKRQSGREKPLTMSETTHHQPSSTHSSPLHALANTSRPLEGILPACFHSQQQCTERTRNCTGHGECKLRYHDKTAQVNKDCFSCMCTKTTSTSKSGKVTTHWAGPACQKKDVSTQFWLIALFTVSMIFLIGFAIGQVWEMGDQELPSVIGAGVSGPTARK